ncbi:proliferation disrupter, partial [Carabus blaptoides fortunei]
SDYVFKSGIINPTMEDNYIQKKWVELSEQLNSCGEGPHLTSEEWKKRFTDWKYAVRAKSRKILEHQNKTGSGPPIDVKLTPIEEKALSLWGKIVITGPPFIDSYDGIPSRTEQSPEIDISSILHMPVDIIHEDIVGNSTITAEAEQPCSSKPLRIINEGSTSEEQPSMTPVLSRARHRPKP